MKTFITSQGSGKFLTKNQKSPFRLTTQLLSLVVAMFLAGTGCGQVYKSQATATASGASIAIAKPANLAVGDLMIAQISRSSNNNVNMTEATSSGWSLITQNQYRTDGSDRWHVTILQKFATASDVSASNFSFSGNSTDDIMGAIMAFSDACQISVLGSWGSTTDDNTYSAPTISTRVVNSMVVMLGAVDDNGRLANDNSWTFNGVSMVERYDLEFDAGKDMGIAAATTNLNALTSGSGSATLSGSDRNTSILLAISGSPTVISNATNSVICSGSSTSLSSTVQFNNSLTDISFNGFESVNIWNYVSSSSSSGTVTSPVRTGSRSFRLRGSDNQNIDPRVTLENVSLLGFTNVSLSVAFASRDVDSQDDLWLDVSYDNGVNWNSTKLIDGFENFSCDFNSTSTTNTTSGVVVNSNPFTLNVPTTATQITVRLRFDERSGQDNRNDFYYIDDIRLVGIPVVSTYAWTSSPSGFTSTAQNPGAVSPTESTTYNLTVTNNLGCTATSSVNVTVDVPQVPYNLGTNSYHVWTGKVDDSWSNEQNWATYNGSSWTMSASGIPNQNDDVIIPAVCPGKSQPVIDVVNATCDSLIITSGGHLTINQLNNQNGFKVNDDVVLRSGGQLTMGANSILHIEGGSLRMLSGSTFTPGSGRIEFHHVNNHPNSHVLLAESTSTAVNNVFYDLEFHGNGGQTILPLQLQSNINVKNEFKVVSNNIDINGKVLDLGTTGFLTEGNGNSNTNLIFDSQTTNPGYIQATASIVASTTIDPGKLGMEFNTVAGKPMGTTIVKRYHSVRPLNGINSSIKRIYDVSPQLNGNNYIGGLDLTLKFRYHEAMLDGNTENTLGLYRADDWLDPTFDQLGGVIDLNGNKLTITNYDHFSIVTLGSVENPVVLPIELVSFQANCKEDNTVSVTWTTASEHNTSHYVVEKSRDGINWSVLGQTAAAGNSTQLLNYEMIDSEKAIGTTYYRLTQFDNDGVFEVFDPVSVNCKGTTANNHIMTYPNPSDASFYVSLYTETMEGNAQLSITDGSGRVVYSTSVNIQDGNNVFHIGDMNAAPGMYYIQVSNGTTTTDIVKHSLR